jgi:hypothetical protein
MSSSDTTYLTTVFKKNLHDWLYMNATNSSANIPVLSLYISQVTNLLIQMSYLYQSRYHILIYNPLDTDTSLYFSQNPLFIENKYIMATSFTQLNETLLNCLAVVQYCEANYSDTFNAELYDYLSRIQYVVNLLLRFFAPDTGVDYDPSHTAFEIGYNSTTIYVSAG